MDIHSLNSFTVRRAEIRDVPLLLKLVEDGVKEGNYNSLDFDPERAAYFLFRMIAHDHFIDVFTDAGEIVGVMAGELITPYFSTDQIAIDQGIFVKKEYRKTSVTRELILSFVRWSKEHGAKQIRPCTSTGAENLGAAYLDLGFVVAGKNYLFEVN